MRRVPSASHHSWLSTSTRSSSAGCCVAVCSEPRGREKEKDEGLEGREGGGGRWGRGEDGGRKITERGKEWRDRKRERESEGAEETHPGERAGRGEPCLPTVHDDLGLLYSLMLRDGLSEPVGRARQETHRRRDSTHAWRPSGSRGRSGQGTKGCRSATGETQGVGASARGQGKTGRRRCAKPRA